MVFDIAFKDVVLSEERTVSREGRISGMSRYKGRRVNIVVEKASELECNDPPWREPYHYQAAVDAVYDIGVSGSDPTTEEIMEAI